MLKKSIMSISNLIDNQSIKIGNQTIKWWECFIDIMQILPKLKFAFTILYYIKYKNDLDQTTS